MSPELWDRVQQITAEALELDAPEREAFVEQRCEGDAEALAAVRVLLDTEQEMGGEFLEAPALDPARESYGAYRATGEIGRGGMSVVYLGERISGEFDRKVAIKVMLSPGAIAHEETRILASLEHPNIARLFDAGTTASGFRYLVMEFVDGERVDEHCRKLDRSQKLRLFLDVCAGVQHANRALVVHRDLKPGNILVTREGVVKLLDFGIAKMLSPEPGAEHTNGMRAWTPDYASPEQILGKPVSTSTDVYSLGVLLCELLGGARPRNFGELPLGEVVERALREEIETVPLDGDLGAIAKKALRREASERYESAAAMAADIERYLEGRPIVARPQSWSYAARKFIGRHRWPLAATAVAVCALIGTTAVAVTQARRAAQRFEQARGLATSVLFELYPEVEKLDKSLEARRLLVRRSLEYLDGLSRDPSAGTALELEMSRGYVQLADILGTTGMASLGDSGGALARSERAVELARRALRRDPGFETGERVLFEALTRVATTNLLRGSPEKGLPAAREIVEIATRNAGRPGAAGWDHLAAEALHDLASILAGTKGGIEESLQYWDKALEIRQRLAKEQPQSDGVQRDLARTHAFIAESLVRNGLRERAEPHIREAYGINKARMEAGAKGAETQLASNLGYLGVLAWNREANAEAAGFFEEQLELRKRIAARDPADVHMARAVASSTGRLGHAYMRMKRFAEAIALGERALGLQRSFYSRDSRNRTSAREVFFAATDLADTYTRSGRLAQACPLVAEAGAILERLTSSGAPMEPGPVRRLNELKQACAN